MKWSGFDLLFIIRKFVVEVMDNVLVLVNDDVRKLNFLRKNTILLDLFYRFKSDENQSRGLYEICLRFLFEEYPIKMS